MSRTHTWISVFALALTAAAGIALPSAAGEGADWLRPKAEYMAHTVMQAESGQIRGRVWASGDKERRELRMKGATHTVILRKDRGVSWILMPEQRMYLEQPIGAKGTDGLSGGNLQREAFGQESVNGVSATKYRVHGTAGDGRPFESLMWMTGQEIPVRIVTGHGRERIQMELDRLSVGAIDPRRFEIPHGYQHFELPGPAKADLEALRRRYDRAPQ